MTAQTQGTVFALERCSLHDGPGLRTTVFLKGCPLHCLWCHNPESQSYLPELYDLHEKCVLCGSCAAVCSKDCHRIEDNVRHIQRSRCDACGDCTRACPRAALEIKGYSAKAEAVMAVVEEDRAFYDASGGGMTVSGGEPMAQFEFTKTLLSLAKAAGIHTCIETSGFAPVDRWQRIKETTDLILFDFKESDPGQHLLYTGARLNIILNSLYELERLGAPVILRCPLIPGINDRTDHLHAIAALAGKLRNITEINVMPYHPMGKSKSHRIGRLYPLEETGYAEQAQWEEWIRQIQERTGVPVKKG
ncbi:MAG: Pyruvate formate-lyase activating enzyme [Paenibacillaceae bacterium]|jgi:pyruvate formate lyase activating enzyme|nr:Pyruvate formate-lyase activating enzyme [Paenibacillaceae bacterium]